MTTKENKNRFNPHPIITTQYPAWIEPLPMHVVNARLMRIIQFYVFNSPCKDASWGRISMEQYGWINYWNSSRFRTAIFDSAELSSFHAAETATELAKIWPNKVDYSMSLEEFAYFVKAGEENPLVNLFHRIRNSFAHGRFRVNGEYFFFEDVKLGGEQVTARICLNINTLENWMRIIKCEGGVGETLQQDMLRKREAKTH